MTPAPALQATRLRCEYMTAPVGVGSRHPVFDWTPVGQPGAQVAYQIIVASSVALAAAGAGDVWDSGQVTGTDVIGIAYGGTPLRSRTRYWWTVRLWSGSVPGPYAAPTTFETGLLEPSDWTASWIGAPGIHGPLLRTEFTVPADVTSARAYVAALGCYELRLNGAKVGDAVLDPATTNYDHDPALVDGEGKPTRMIGARVLYATYDITAHLQAGANGVGVMLGNGWYSAGEENGPGPLPRTPWGDGPRALVQLEIETSAGERIVVGSGADWTVAAGPITFDDPVHGEVYDARREFPGWDSAGFAAAWDPATVVEPPQARLHGQDIPPVRVLATRAPVTDGPTASGARLLDFGQHHTGWTRITVSGPAGAQVVLRHAGEVDAAGELDDDANMGAWIQARQTDTYILRGDGQETWEPRFTLHGFRYVEITAPPEVTVHEAVSCLVHSDLGHVGRFTCADPLLNRVHDNAVWSMRASLQGFPQDAAERAERVGWTGDPGWAIGEYLLNVDALGFWRKWLDDLADAQLPDGRFPVVCPIHWRGSVELPAPDGYLVPADHDPVLHFPYGAWPDFSMSTYPAIAWALYEFYGDRSILARHYPGMRRGLEFMLSRSTDGILTTGLGDHMEPQADRTCSVFPQRTSRECTSTAWLYAVADIVARSARVLGRAEDAAQFAGVAAGVKDAFTARFLNVDSATYDSGSQTAAALALWLGLVPDEHRTAVLAELVADIERRDWHLDTGTMGTAALQHVLPAEVMHRLATQTTFPSWGHQIALGATTIWETWGGDPTFSRNMKLLVATEKFLFHDVAGLAPAAPGWSRIRIRPQLTGVLAHASAQVRTPRGVAAVEWSADPLQLTVTVPASSTAEVWLPAGSVPSVDGVAPAAATHPDSVRFEIGGGTHRITTL